MGTARFAWPRTGAGDSNLFEPVLRGRFNWTAFGNAQRGLDKIHVQYIDGNVLPGQRPSLVPKCGICNAIVVVDSRTNGMCNGCRSMWYCCSEHQRLHWPLHRVFCKQLQKTHAVQLIAQPEDTHMTPEAAAFLFGKVAVLLLHGSKSHRRCHHNRPAKAMHH